MIFTEGEDEIAVEIEPIKFFRPVQPCLGREKDKDELKTVGEKLRNITAKEVTRRIILVPYFEKSRPLPFKRIESELQEIAGQRVELKPIP